MSDHRCPKRGCNEKGATPMKCRWCAHRFHVGSCEQRGCKCATLATVRDKSVSDRDVERFVKLWREATRGGPAWQDPHA